MSAPKIKADRVKELSITEGILPFALLGEDLGFQKFSFVMIVGDTCYYVALHKSSGEWETGIGTYSALNTLTRTTILTSSNSNSKVVFTAGEKNIFISPIAKSIEDIAYGGTGLSALGSANQVLSVKADLSGLEYRTLAALTLDALTDVVSPNPTDKNLLQYNFSSLQWETVPGPIGTVVGTTDIQTLTNKTLVTPLSNSLSAVPVASGAGNSVTIAAGSGVGATGTNNGGNLVLNPGEFATSGTRGTVLIDGLNVGQGKGTVGGEYANTVFGFEALGSITTGYNNTAIGHQALKSNIGQSMQTAIGWNALKLNNGGSNTAVGDRALGSSVGGYGNTAVGLLALKNSEGHLNVAVGLYSAVACGGNYNTAIGPYSGYTGVGNLETGIGNILVGYNVGMGSGNNAANNSIVIGYNGVGNGTNTTTIGNTSTTATYLHGTISAIPVTSGAGNSLTIAAGSGVTSGAGGSLILQAGLQVTSGGDGKVVVKQVAGQTSNLQEWQNSAGTVLSRVSNSGTFLAASGSASNCSFSFTSQNGDSGFFNAGSGSVGYAGGGDVNCAFMRSVGFSIHRDLTLAWDLGNAGSGLPDTVLRRDGAVGILAMRNGPNKPQSLRLYNTYTDGTSYERGILEWKTNVFTVGTEKGSVAGSARSLEIQTDGTTRLAISTAGTLGIGTISPSALTHIVTAAAVKGLIVQGAAAQTANLQEWQNSSGTALASVDAAGKVISNALAAVPVTSGLTASVTAASSSGGILTYTAANTFTVGRTVSVTGLTTASGTTLNIAGMTIATASSTQFTVVNATVGVSSGTGTATAGGNTLADAASNAVTAGSGGNRVIKAGDGVGVGKGGDIELRLSSQGSSGGNGGLSIFHPSGVLSNRFTTNNADANLYMTGNFNVGSLSSNSYITASSFETYFVRLNSSSYNAPTAIIIADTGRIDWSSNSTTGTNLGDTAIGRAAAGVLKISLGAVSTTTGGSLSFPSATTAIAANTNDLALTASAFQRLNCTAVSGAALTGIAPPSGGTHVDGRMIRVYNVGTANLTIVHNATSTAANRIFSATGADIVVPPKTVVDLTYDATDNGSGVAGWKPFAPGSVAANAITATSVASGAGNSLTIAAGSGVTSGAGGSLILQAGIQATTGGDGRIILRRAAGQTSNLLEFQTSAGLNSGSIDQNGCLILMNRNHSSISGIALVPSAGGANNRIVSMFGGGNGGFDFYGGAFNGSSQIEGSNITPLYMSISQGGNVAIGGFSTPSARLHVMGSYNGSPSNTKIVIVQGMTGQTENLQEWQNSAGTALAFMDASGNFNAITKSFNIPHPTKEGGRLRYASLEGPENSVYVRGSIKGENEVIIYLPEYWPTLVHEDSLTVQTTAVGFAQPTLFVKEKSSSHIVLSADGPISADYMICAERRDVPKLEVES